MIYVLIKSKKERYIIKIIRFCKENHTIMYNFMISIEIGRYQHLIECSTCKKYFWMELERKGIFKRVNENG